MIKAKSGNVRKARVEQGYNQSDVCEGTGLNISSYSQIENGKTSLRPKTAKKICVFLNKTFDDLFDLIDEKEGAKV